ncbi:hypothetical protein [Yeosuana marina]|uniref:hypothetical protein n=1 Tax=Yeosuana marina TaxID=1565536 RepID=UPI0030EC50D1|tara:strand:+ start:421 stop:1518 length:1098 start_codon:yes stop_codon:yes gene_type:complete
MLFTNYLKRKIPFLAILGLLFGLSSCGSYQYVGVDNDGIYGSSYPNNDTQETVVVAQNKQNTNNGYYKNYFRDKSLEYDNMTNGEVFTDIDSYEGAIVENDTIDNNYQGYAGWGQSNSSVTINYIDNGFNNWGWNNGFGIGWNTWGWNRWNNWGFYDDFWYRPYFYGGYYNSWAFYNPYRYGYYGYGHPYYYGGYNGYYGNHVYSRRGLSYSASRRGSLSSNYNTNLSNRTGYSRNSAYSTSRRSSVNANSNTVNRYSNSRRSSVNTNSNTVNRYSSSRPRVYTNTQRRTTASTPASNSTSRSSSVRRSYTPANSNYNRSSSSNSTPSRNYSTRSSSSSSPSYSRSSSSSVRSSSGSSSSGRRRG